MMVVENAELPRLLVGEAVLPGNLRPADSLSDGISIEVKLPISHRGAVRGNPQKSIRVVLREIRISADRRLDVEIGSPHRTECPACAGLVIEAIPIVHGGAVVVAPVDDVVLE